jgi:hypothetical protein
VTRVLVTAVALAWLVFVLAVTGCGSNPCDHHGGTRALVNGWFYCNDGTVF